MPRSASCDSYCLEALGCGSGTLLAACRAIADFGWGSCSLLLLLGNGALGFEVRHVLGESAGED
jgi:hypothetical protein